MKPMIDKKAATKPIYEEGAAVFQSFTGQSEKMALFRTLEVLKCLMLITKFCHQELLWIKHDQACSGISWYCPAPHVTNVEGDDGLLKSLKWKKIHLSSRHYAVKHGV